MKRFLPLSKKTKGILCIISAAFFFALMNLFIKLAGDIPTLQKAFFRNAVAILFSFIILKRNRISIQCSRRNIPLIIGRCFFGTIGIFFNFYAIDHLMISDASMLNKLSPFFAILFSYFILQEKAKTYQLLCVATALTGTLFILKPGGAGLLSFPALIGILGGAAAGMAYTLLRKASKKAIPGSLIVFFFSVFSCLCSLPYCILYFTPMSASQLLFLLLTGLAAAGGQFSITAAYTYAPAKELSVYDYSQIFFTGILGYVFLGELPDLFSYIGYVIIIGASIFMFVLNHKNNGQDS